MRELGKPATVDADTLFIIASNTKALSTLLLAKLVDRGKFTWDTPVTSVYPEFKLGDADTTKQVLMKHLVCACTGMPRQDMEWLFEYKSATPKSALSLLGTMQPTTKFGEVFQYSNLLAAAAGFIGGHVLDPEQGARRRLRRGDAQGDLRAARHEGDHVRLQAGAQGQPRLAARRRHRRQAWRSTPMEHELRDRRRCARRAAPGRA